MPKRVAWVVGGSHGIGRAVAERLLDEGATVVVSDTQPPSAPLRERIVWMEADVRDPRRLMEVARTLIDREAGMDVAVNCVGIEGPSAPLGAHDGAAWRDVVDVNLSGMRHGLQAQTAVMRAGAIVNLASVASSIAFPGAAAYAATKHAVVGLTRAAALETASRGLRINAVCPGSVRTPLLERVQRRDGHTEQTLASLHPLGRIAEPGEVADVVRFLCSDEAKWITGQAWAIDGGWTAGHRLVGP